MSMVMAAVNDVPVATEIADGVDVYLVIYSFS